MSSSAAVTYDLGLLERSSAAWARSHALRAYYGDLLGAVMQRAASGRTLELGSGIGAIKEFFPHVETSDLAGTRFVNRAVSAYAIEDTGVTWDSIVLVDVLHHLCEPWRFFASAAAALRPGGRIVIADPAATPLGRLFYRLFHHEPCRPAEVTADAVFSPDPATGEFANMGMAWAFFRRDLDATSSRLAKLGLRVVSIRWRDVIAYPMTGGFSRPSPAPAAVVRALLAAERVLPQWLMSKLGLRMIVVIEKS